MKTGWDQMLEAYWERVHEEHDDGEPIRPECPHCQAWFKQSALEAGIPLSVIEGKTRLRDHFSPAYIASQARKVPVCGACGSPDLQSYPPDSVTVCQDCNSVEDVRHISEEDYESGKY